MKRHEYSKIILTYLNYEIVIMHGINCIVYYVAVRNTPVQTSTFVSKKLYISTLVTIWRQNCFQFLNRHALYISSLFYMVDNFQHNTVVINQFQSNYSQNLSRHRAIWQSGCPVSIWLPSPECSITLQHHKVSDGMIPSNVPESLLQHPYF